MLTTKPATFNRSQFQMLVKAVQQKSGCSLHELHLLTDLNSGYISQILNGHRRPSRDTLIKLCACGWLLSLEEMNTILESAGYKPL
jgi:transcriptional regulator with XRE-family HTH domain